MQVIETMKNIPSIPVHGCTLFRLTSIGPDIAEFTLILISKYCNYVSSVQFTKQKKIVILLLFISFAEQNWKKKLRETHSKSFSAVEALTL